MAGKTLEELLEEFRRASGDKTTKTAKHLAKFESNFGRAKGTEKIGMTKGVFHITRDTALQSAPKSLKEKIKKMSKKEFSDYTAKNPKVEAELAGRHTKRLYTNLKKEGVNLDNITEEEKAAVIGNLYNYENQPSLKKSLKELSQDRFIKSPEYIEEQKKKVAKNMDITTAEGKTQAGLVKRRTAEKELFLNTKKEKGRSPQSIEDSVNIQDSSIKKEEPMGIKRPEEEEDKERMLRRMERMQKAGETTDASLSDIEEKVKQGRDPVGDFKRLAKDNATIATLKVGQSSPKYEQLSRVDQDQVAEDATNAEKMTNAATQSQKDKSEGKQGSVKNEFMEAITYFLPSIAGLAVGGMIGGEEGAAQGAQLGMKAGESYYSMKERQQEREMKYGPQAQMRGRKFQQTEYTDKDGNPITYDPVANKHLKADGTEATTDDFQNAKDARQARRLERTDKSLQLSEMKTRHNISKDTQLSDKQAETFAAMTATKENIKEIKTLQKDVLTGIGIKQFRNMQELANKSPENWTKLKAFTESLRANYVKSISGAQVSEKEFERLSALIPSVGDAPKVFMAKLEAMSKVQNANYKGFRASILKTQRIKGMAIKALDEELIKIEKMQKEDDDERKKKLERRDFLRAKKAKSNK